MPKVPLPEGCDNNIEVNFIIYEADKKINRSFKDKLDLYEGNQFHPIYLLPCGFHLSLQNLFLFITKTYKSILNGKDCTEEP